MADKALLAEIMGGMSKDRPLFVKDLHRAPVGSPYDRPIPVSPGPKRTVLSADQEREFRRWWSIGMKDVGADAGPDDPRWGGVDFRAEFLTLKPEDWDPAARPPDWSPYVGDDSLNSRESEVLDFIRKMMSGAEAQIELPPVRAGRTTVGYPEKDLVVLGRYSHYTDAPQDRGWIELYGGRVGGAKTALDSSAVFSHELGHWIDESIQSRITAPGGQREKYLDEYQANPLLGTDSEARADNFGYVISRMARNEPLDPVFNVPRRAVLDLRDQFREGR